MSKFIVEGGHRLTGEIQASGRKNSAVAVLPAALLASEPSVLENIPTIEDVNVYCQIISALGAKISKDSSGKIIVEPAGLSRIDPPYELSKKLRASYYLLGVLLGKFGMAKVPLPGGCDIGARPIDQHLKGFQALGAEIKVEHGVINAFAPKLRGNSIYLDVASVGATINLIIGATLAEGVTVIENAAKESHVVDVANFINAMGGKIVGAGTKSIKIKGVKSLKGATHSIIPDEIEAATYMMAAVGTLGDVTVGNVIPAHLSPITAKLREAGAEVIENGDFIRVRCNSRPRAVSIKTLPYPGFPTDAQQQMTSLLAISDGTSFVTETIFESRFKHVDELRRMGANITVQGRTAIIKGVERLTGAKLKASDLRTSAALVLAALFAEGQTEIDSIEHADRGYEKLDEKLRTLNARVQRYPG